MRHPWRADIADLRGKYYGTEIVISDYSTGDDVGVITVWVHKGRPSDRELDREGRCTTEDWNNNVEVDSGWGDGAKIPIRQAGIWCDSHYETQADYLIARAICAGINNSEFDF